MANLIRIGGGGCAKLAETTFTMYDNTTAEILPPTGYQGMSKVTVTSEPRQMLGIRWLISQSDPTGERLYDAVDKTFAVASSTTEEVQNDFDNLFPYSGIETVQLEGQTMVKIPKFWYKRLYDETYDGYAISETQIDETWEIHPAFLKGDKDYEFGLEESDFNDFVYIAKYFAIESGDTVASSYSGYPILVDSRATAREYISSIGDGWTCNDYTGFSLMRILWFVASGTRDSQSIMPCNQSGDSNRQNGDSVNAVSTCGQIGETCGWFYGIENPWSGMYELIDGINFDDSTTYLCTKIENYADDTSTNYTELGYEKATSGGFISKEGYSAEMPFVSIATECEGSESTYFCDGYLAYQNMDKPNIGPIMTQSILGGSSWCFLYCFGKAYSDTDFGVSRFGSDGASGFGIANFGFRLLYRSY